MDTHEELARAIGERRQMQVLPQDVPAELVEYFDGLAPDRRHDLMRKLRTGEGQRAHKLAVMVYVSQSLYGDNRLAWVGTPTDGRWS